MSELKEPTYSYSARKQGAQCMWSFVRLYLVRDIKRTYNAAQQDGLDVHDALQTALERKRELPPKLAYAQWALDYVNSHPGLKFAEKWMSVGLDGVPVTDRDAYKFNTLKADAISLRAVSADVFDYKNGKHYPDMAQMQDAAAIIMAFFPYVLEVTGHILFLKYPGTVEKQTYKRENIMDYVQPWVDFREDVLRAMQTNNFPKTPSEYACRWCPVVDCHHNPDYIPAETV
jgi:hypothetical protein